MKIKCFIFFLFLSCPLHAESPKLYGILQFDQPEVAPALQVFAVLTILSLAPGIVMMLTSFTRIIVVLSILRNALGLQQTPPNSVLISLALFLSFFIMMPVAKQIYNESYIPWEKKEINLEMALQKAAVPLQNFMLNQTREKDLSLLIRLSNDMPPASASEVKFYQLIPAFMLSELQTAFQIGFMIFLPFLLVDLIVSGILVTMGMMMMPPMSISLPIKILLFVLIDGFNLVTEALAGSFNTF